MTNNKKTVGSVTETEVAVDTAEVVETTTEEIVKPEGELTAEAPQKVDEGVKEVSEKIDALLKEEGLALQPYLNSSQFGIVPQVALVRVPENTEVKE